MSKSKGQNLDNRYSQFPGYSPVMGITKFQDFLFEINDRPERQRTDTELSEEMHQEHPLGVRIHSDIRETRFGDAITPAPKIMDPRRHAHYHIGLRTGDEFEGHILSLM